MGAAELDSLTPFHLKPHNAAVVICRTEQGNLHIGVAYKFAGRVSFIHLGVHDRLFDDWRWPVVWAVPEAQPEQLFFAAAVCRRIAQRKNKDPRMPYGINLGASKFDPNGKLVLAPGSIGVTCATFALAIFRSANVELVDVPDWPIRQNDTEDLELLRMIKPVTPADHFLRLEQEVREGVRRVRPAEVVGACSCTPPARFKDATQAVPGVIALVDKK